MIVGGDGVSYGSKPPAGTTWKSYFMAEVASQMDLSRVDFVGTVPYNVFIGLLQVSACHV